MNIERKIELKSKTENLKIIREFVSDFAKEKGFSVKEISDMILAVDEAATNIIKHAYGFDEDKEIIVNVKFENNKLEISLIDFGKKFDPDKAKLPDIKESLKLKKSGGLGIYLMKKLMDDVIYEIDNPNYNKITLIKKRNESE